MGTRARVTFATSKKMQPSLRPTRSILVSKRDAFVYFASRVPRSSRSCQSAVRHIDIPKRFPRPKDESRPDRTARRPSLTFRVHVSRFYRSHALYRKEARDLNTLVSFFSLFVELLDTYLYTIFKRLDFGLSGFHSYSILIKLSITKSHIFSYFH